MRRKRIATGSSSIRSYFAPRTAPTPTPAPAPAENRPQTPDRESPLSSLSSISPPGSFTATPSEPPDLRLHAGSPAHEEVTGNDSRMPSASPAPLSSPPAKPEPRRPVSRDAEIAASDDEDSDGFEALDALLAPRRGPTTPSAKRVHTHHFSTPDRRPESLFSSPLTIQPRVVRHFAMDQLLKDAKKDSSTEETYKRLQARKDDDENGAPNPRMAGGSLRTTLMATVGDEQDHRLDKVVRAVERTESAPSTQGWYFFQPSVGSPKKNRYEFPSGVWRDICGEESIAKTPEDLDFKLVDFSLRLRKGALSDELFLWMLDEVCLERSGLRRDEMCRIMCLYASDSVARRLTPSHLEGLFMLLGASGDIRTFIGKDSGGCKTVGAPEEGYYQRDWRRLYPVLEVLLALSHQLEHNAMLYCIQVVLAMSVDSELLHDPEVLLHCRKLIFSITSVFPPSEWDAEITKFIYNMFPYPPMRLRSVMFIPTSTKDMHDLRRRMAAVFFFDDVSLIERSPDTMFELRDIREHLQSAMFKIRPDTDYASLRALLLLLDIAVGTGSRPESDDPLQGDVPASAFDAEVDGVVTTLRRLGRGINDTGMKSIQPMEAKMVLDWVGERLAHSVRTRPKPKISIYDLPDRPAVDTYLPRQQNLMKKFLQSSRQGESGDKASV